MSNHGHSIITLLVVASLLAVTYGQFQCGRYQWKPISRLTATDIPIGTGFVGNTKLYSCRMPVSGRLITGKATLNPRSCWVAYGGREIGSGGSQNFDLLIGNRPAEISSPARAWAPLPSNAFGSGWGTYVAYCRWGSGNQIQVTPGTVYENSRMLFPYAGRVIECDSYGVFVC